MKDYVEKHNWLVEDSRIDLTKPFYNGRGGFVISSEWKQSFYRMILSNVHDHGESLVVRVDLRYPDTEEFEHYISPDNKDYDKFIRRIKHVLSSKSGKEKYDYAKLIGHGAVREFGKRKHKKHYHCLLVLKNVKYLGNFNSECGVQYLIRETWYRITGGHSQLYTPEMINQRAVDDIYYADDTYKLKVEDIPYYSNRGALDINHVNYLCKLDSKLKDDYRNIIISKHSNSVPYRLSKLELAIGDAESKECSALLEEGLKKYKKSLVIFGLLKNYRGKEERDKLELDKLTTKFIHLLHNTLMDNRKGGITFGAMSNSQEGIRLCIIMSGGRYETVGVLLRGAIQNAFNALLSYRQEADYGFIEIVNSIVEYKKIVGEEESGRKAYINKVMRIISDETIAPVCFLNDGTRNETVRIVEKPARLSPDEMKKFEEYDTTAIDIEIIEDELDEEQECGPFPMEYYTDLSKQKELRTIP